MSEPRPKWMSEWADYLAGKNPNSLGSSEPLFIERLHKERKTTVAGRLAALPMLTHDELEVLAAALVVYRAQGPSNRMVVDSLLVAVREASYSIEPVDG